MLKQSHNEYSGYRQPGIRLSEPILPSLSVHSSEARHPRFYAIHLFDKAHATMLAEEGLISLENGMAILSSLREMEQMGVEDVRLEVGGGMHSGEQYLIRQLTEEVGGRIQLGRSSGDLNEVATRIYTRDQLLALMNNVNNLRRVLIDIAKQHLDTVLPGYTHAQHAQPTTYGHQLMSWVSVLERDFYRLYHQFKHVNMSPAGAAIMTGSDFPLNRHTVAEYLGFHGVEKNTFDAILSLDYLFSTMCVLAVLYMNLSRWADDLMLWITSEFGFVDIPDRFCGTSSIMMQKKNFSVPLWIKGAAAETVGDTMMAMMVDKGPTGFPIVEHNATYRALTQSFCNLLRSFDWLIEVMPTLQINKEIMAESAGAHWAQASDVAGMLVREKDLPWRTAHQIVGIVIRLSYERGLKPKETTPELLDEASIAYMGEPLGISEEFLEEALDPVASVYRRTLYGGPAPSEAMKRLGEYEDCLTKDRQLLETARTGVERGLANLEQSIDNLLYIKG